MRRFVILAATSTLALLLPLAGPGMLWAEAPRASSTPARWQPPPPPKIWTAPEDHGYMDGVDAAWLDLADHLRPKPSRHLIYQKPPASVKVNRRYFYREGFRKGYDVVYTHARRHLAAAQRSRQPAGI